MSEPTRERKRADLARARGYTVQEVGEAGSDFCYQLANPPDAQPFYYRWRRTEAEAWADAPNPYESAADSRALCEWLATQPVEVTERFETELTLAMAKETDDLRCTPLYYLCAKKEMIANAAWLAITSAEQPKASPDPASPSLPPTF